MKSRRRNAATSSGGSCSTDSKGPSPPSSSPHGSNFNPAYTAQEDFAPEDVNVLMCDNVCSDWMAREGKGRGQAK